jgi:hypothetical protein
MVINTKGMFTFFPELPAEIRLQVWNFALHDPERRVVIIHYNIDTHGIIRFKSRTRPLGSSALLYTCSESRDLALAVYFPAFGDAEFDPPFPKPLRDAVAKVVGGMFKGKKRATQISAKSILQPPLIYLDFLRDAIYFQQKPYGESVFDGVLRGMPQDQRKAIKVLGIEMDLCPMSRFEHFHHLLCDLDEWVLFASGGVGEARAPFSNVQLSTVFFEEQNHPAGSISEKLQRQIQGAFERRREGIVLRGQKVPKVKVEDHTNVQKQVSVVHRS